MTNIEKNRAIGDARRATFRRRASMLCKTFKFKIDRSSLSKGQQNAIQMLFVESKWIYNYLLSHQDGLYDINAKYKELNTITHLDKDRNEISSNIQYVGSSIKQELIQTICNEIKGLSALKKRGFSVGKLKFKSEINSIPLKQYGITHSIRGNKFKIQGVKKEIRVNGLKQLSIYDNIEYANAHILYDGYDYFIALTCYIDKTVKENEYKNDIIGIDFGCKDTITLSNGDKVKISIGESERLKKLQAKLARQVKRSNNWYKTKSLIRKEYNHMANKKEDISNKIVHDIISSNRLVITQNDDINEWKTNSNVSKTIQHSIIGRIKTKLKGYDNVIFLDQWFPTSKYCPKCGNKNQELTLSNRTFVCPICGHTDDRDIHAANNMIYFYLKYKDATGTVDTSKLVNYNTYNKFVAQQEDTTSSALC